MWGVSRKKVLLNKIINIGSRCSLHVNHVLRFFGQSGECCPHGYYEGTEISVEALMCQVCGTDVPSGLMLSSRKMSVYYESRRKKILSTELKALAAVTLKNETKMKDNKKPNTVAAAKAVNAVELASHAFQLKEETRIKLSRKPVPVSDILYAPCDNSAQPLTDGICVSLHNSNFEVEDFEQFLEAAHCDFRAYKPPGARRSDKSYADCAALGIERANKKTGEREIVNGVKGHMRFASLPSATTRNAIIPEPFHVLGNLAKLVINIFGGRRAGRDSTIQLCAAENRFIDVREEMVAALAVAKAEAAVTPQVPVVAEENSIASAATTALVMSGSSATVTSSITPADATMMVIEEFPVLLRSDRPPVLGRNMELYPVVLKALTTTSVPSTKQNNASIAVSETADLPLEKNATINMLSATAVSQTENATRSSARIVALLKVNSQVAGVGVQDDSVQQKLRKVANSTANPDGQKKKKKAQKVVSVTAHKVYQRAAEQFNAKTLPWSLKPEDQNRHDAAHNSILFPKGTKTNFCSKNILTHTDVLKGHDKVQYLCCFIVFDLSFTPLPDEYKNLWSLVSQLVCDIDSPVISLSREVNILTGEQCYHLDNLLHRSVEMCSLMEMMLPDSEQMYTTHQVVDTVGGMQQFGPIRGWWAYGGERMMRFFKKHCPAGGVNPLKTLTEASMREEDNKRNFYVRDLKNLDNHKTMPRYRDNRIKLLGKCKDLKSSNWTGWMFDCLMQTIKATLDTQEIDQIVNRSPFYRVYLTYSKCKAHFVKYLNKTFEKVDYVGFYLWISLISDFIDEQGSKPVLNLAKGVCDDRHPLDRDCNETLNEYVDKGILYTCDFPFIKELAAFRPLVYARATVKGVTMRARGQDCCESQFSATAEPLNPNNDLKLHWYKRAHYSSWCKATEWFIGGQKQVKPRPMYSQVNFFFRLVAKQDPFIHGLAFANVTARAHDTYNVTSAVCYPYIDLELTEKDTLITYNATTQFLSLNYVSSTNVAVCGITADHGSRRNRRKPIMAHDISRKLNCGKKEGYFSYDTSAIATLALIDMHPQRRLVDIGFDESKLFE